MYARTNFNDVYVKYQTYHKQIHDELLKTKRAEINEIAKLDELYQDNMSFQVLRYGEEVQNNSTPGRDIRSGVSSLQFCCCTLVVVYCT